MGNTSEKQQDAGRAKSGGPPKASKEGTKLRRGRAAPDFKTPPCFTSSEAKQIKDYFKRVQAQKQARDEDAYFEVEDLEKLPELSFNPMVTRVGESVYDELLHAGLRENEVDIAVFLGVLAVFHVNTPLDVKQRHAFLAFDNDGDGLVSRSDLVYALSSIFPGLPMAELQLQADFVLDACGRDEGECLTAEDFAALFDHTGFQRFFFIAF